MNKYEVYGSVKVEVMTTVYAEDPDDALNKARDEFDELEAFCGNGGSDKLIGTSLDNVSIAAYDIIHYDFAECIDVDIDEDEEDD